MLTKNIIILHFVFLSSVAFAGEPAPTTIESLKFLKIPELKSLKKFGKDPEVNIDEGRKGIENALTSLEQNGSLAKLNITGKIQDLKDDDQFTHRLTAINLIQQKGTEEMAQLNGSNTDKTVSFNDILERVDRSSRWRLDVTPTKKELDSMPKNPALSYVTTVYDEANKATQKLVTVEKSDYEIAWALYQRAIADRAKLSDKVQDTKPVFKEIENFVESYETLKFGLAMKRATTKEISGEYLFMNKDTLKTRDHSLQTK
jgi:hypothetical protein